MLADDGQLNTDRNAVLDNHQCIVTCAREAAMPCDVSKTQCCPPTTKPVVPLSLTLHVRGKDAIFVTPFFQTPSDTYDISNAHCSVRNLNVVDLHMTRIHDNEQPATSVSHT